MLQTAAKDYAFGQFRFYPKDRETQNSKLHMFDVMRPCVRKVRNFIAPGVVPFCQILRFLNRTTLFILIKCQK